MSKACLFTALALSSTVVAASPASADLSASCSGSTCDGLDPAQTNCVNDARTLLSSDAVGARGVNYGHFELRYSRRCYANWVRFTPWGGISALLSDGTAKASVSGRPWIWRYKTQNSLKGYINQSSPAGLVVTSWTSMIDAFGTTCGSVEFYQTSSSSSGQGDRTPLGTYNSPCIT